MGEQSETRFFCFKIGVFMDYFQCKKEDTSFPRLLKSINKCPEELFYCGDIGIANDMPCIAIIGSRKATKNGLDMAYSLGKIASKEGFAVVNGLAVGCDTMAFRGALSEGGKCIAILPGGLDCIYPRENERLSSDILESGGCLISEYGMGIRPQRSYYVNRDRLQSGISVGVIVAETAEKGGTMHTVRFAEKQSRRLACYYSRLHKNASGNQIMVDRGIGVPLESESSIRNFLDSVRDVSRISYEQLSFL